MSPGQMSLLRSASPFVLLAGGFGGGKSVGLIAKALQLKCANGPTPGLLMAETLSELYTNIVDPMMEALEKSLPRELMPYLVADQKGRKYMQWSDGCKIHLRSAENLKGWAGLTVGWLCGDELRLWRKQSYDFAIARVRKKCPLPQRAFVSTPAMNWLNEEFNTHKERHELITCGTEENAHNLDPDYIENLKSSYSPRMQRAVLRGEFVSLEGAVYDAFDPVDGSPWLVDFEPSANALQRVPVHLAVDPGFRRSAWLWIAQLGPLDWVVFDELMADNASDVACVEIVNERGWPIDEIWCDPAGDATQSVTALDTFAALRGVKGRVSNTRLIRTIAHYRSVAFGVDKLRVLLGGYEGLPVRVRFARRLLDLERGKPRGILKDLAAYSYPEVKDGRPITDEPLKDGIVDHSCLVGCSEVYTRDGWAKLETLGGESLDVLTTRGMLPATVGLTRRQTPVWEIVYDTGQTTVATGDHRFIVSARCRCGRLVADFSWATVLQMRQIFQQTGWTAPGIPAQSGIYRCPWCDTEGRTHTSQEWGQAGQSDRELRGDAGDETLIVPLQAAKKRIPGRGETGGSGMAPEQERARVAQETRARCVVAPRAFGLYVPSVWAGFQVAEEGKREVLPSKLQSHCLATAARDEGYQRVSDIRLAGNADVWCAYVQGAGSFVLKDGSVSSNCDALRYWSVGRWMCDKQLRKKDPVLAKDTRPGYRVAA